MLKSQHTKFRFFIHSWRIRWHVYDDEDYNEISTGEWIVSLILSYIPLIGLIMLLVWAFGGGTSPTKANWAKAQLFIVVAIFGLAIAFYLTILASLAQQYGSMPH